MASLTIRKLDDSIKAEMTKVIKECKEAFLQERQAVGAGK